MSVSTPEIRLLERLSYRAPLAVACRDGVTDLPVTDGLVAEAWLDAEPSIRLAARRSPLSGLLGWGSLPGQFLSTHQAIPPGQLPAAGATPAWVRVTDTAGRYLPVVLGVDVPVTAPVPVPLSSAPARPKGSGVATIRGEVHRADGRALPWSLVRVDTGAALHQTVADARGRFLLYAAYPDALPPLVGSPPVGPGLGAVTWSLTITVRSEPTAFVFAHGTAPADPPTLASITAQGAAQLVAGGNHPSLSATLRFGSPLELALTAVPA